MPRPRSTPAGVAERLQKYLAQRGLASRRGVEEWIRAQRLTVNGRIAELGQKVTVADDIRLDGRPIKTRAAAAAQVFIFNRSPGDPLRESTAERAGADRAPAESCRATIHRGESHARDRRRARAGDLRWRAGGETAARDAPIAGRIQRARARPCWARISSRA